MLFRSRQARFPASGEINRRLLAPDVALEAIEVKYGPAAANVDRTDGLSCDMGAWRFNVRKSNTEPVLRLNVESRGDGELMRQKTTELLAIIDRG